MFVVSNIALATPWSNIKQADVIYQPVFTVKTPSDVEEPYFDDARERQQKWHVVSSRLPSLC